MVAVNGYARRAFPFIVLFIVVLTFAALFFTIDNYYRHGRLDELEKSNCIRMRTVSENQERVIIALIGVTEAASHADSQITRDQAIAQLPILRFTLQNVPKFNC